MRKIIIYSVCLCLCGCMVKKSALDSATDVKINRAEIKNIKTNAGSKQEINFLSNISIEEKITEKDSSGSVTRFTERVYHIENNAHEQTKDSVFSTCEKVVKSQENSSSQIHSTSEKKPNVALWSLFGICIAMIICAGWYVIKKRLFFF